MDELMELRILHSRRRSTDSLNPFDIGRPQALAQHTLSNHTGRAEYEDVQLTFPVAALIERADEALMSMLGVAPIRAAKMCLAALNDQAPDSAGIDPHC